MRDISKVKYKLSRRQVTSLKNNLGIQLSSGENIYHDGQSDMASEIYFEVHQTYDTENQFRKYWKSRGIEVRNFDLICITFNMIFQCQALANPMSQEQVVVNRIYMFFSLLQYVLSISSLFNDRYENQLIFFSHLMVSIRNGIRMLDIENTRAVYEQDGKINNWHFLVKVQMLVSYINLGFYFNNFQMTKLRFSTGIILFILLIVGTTIGTFSVEEIFEQSSQNWTFWIILFGIGAYQIQIRQNMNTRMFQNLVTIIQHNAKFKHIIDHLQESLIILNGQKIEIVNKMFLTQFQKLIPEKVGQSQTQITQTMPQKCLKWVKLKFFKTVNEDIKETKNAFIDLKIFKVFKADKAAKAQEKSEVNNSFGERQISSIDEGKVYSIYDVSQIENVENIIFQIDQLLYVQVKISLINSDDQQLTIIQVEDVSASILYDEQKMQNQLLGMINATVSHELRNPLNSIAAQNILKENLYKQLETSIKKLGAHASDFDQLMHDLNEGLEIQQASTDIMAFMIKDLLDYSQIKAGKFQKNNTNFNIKDAISDVMKLQKHIAEENSIQFFATFNGIADCEGALQNGPIIFTDKDRVMQVLLGLQSNALKFTENGKVEIEVSIVNKVLQISVIDTGCGIPYEDQNKLFKLFGYVQDSKQMNTHGIGLGLTISKQIVEAFGGEIRFSSVPKEGSKFTFTFQLEDQAFELITNHFNHFVLDNLNLQYIWEPLELNGFSNDIKYVQQMDKRDYCEADNYSDIQVEICENEKKKILRHIQDTPSLSQKSSTSLDEKLKRILIVDDQIFNIQALKIIFKYSINISYSEDIIDYANNGLQAVQIVENDLKKNDGKYCSYDLILMDCNMPIMDGYTSASHIREVIYKAKLDQPIIIAVTGHTEREYVQRAIKCGMNMVLSKPVSVNILRYLARELGYHQFEQMQLRIDQNQLNVIDRYVQQMNSCNRVINQRDSISQSSSQQHVSIVNRRVSNYLGIKF